MTDSPVIIVTGAGSGIGRAVCQSLANAGASIALVGRDASRLQETQRFLEQETGRIDCSIFIPADLSKPADAGAVVDAVLRKWGRVDALVNNAAMLEVKPLESMDEAHVLRTFATNTFGPAYLIARCWPTFIKQRAGRVVNISSLATVDPYPGLAAYGASKAALENLTKSIQCEGASHGILAFSIVLGAVETSMLRSVVTKQQWPAERTLDPVEAAKVIAECALGRRDPDAGKPIVVARR